MKTEQTFEDFLGEVKKESPDFVESMGIEYFRNMWNTQKVMQAQMLAVKKAFAGCTTTKGCLADFKNLDPILDATYQDFIAYTTNWFEQNLLTSLTRDKVYKIYAEPGVAAYLKLLRSFHSEKEEPLGVYKEGYIETVDRPVYVYKVPPKLIDFDYILAECEDGTFVKYLLDGLQDYYERKEKARKVVYDAPGNTDFEGKELGEVRITLGNKILRDKFRELQDFAEKQRDALPNSDIDGIVAWDTILNFIYEEGLNSPRWNDYGGK